MMLPAHAPVPGPTRHTSAQEVTQATSRLLSATSGPPFYLLFWLLPLLTLLCASEAAPRGWHHSESSLVQAASGAQPMEATGKRPEGGWSENQGHL